MNVPDTVPPNLGADRIAFITNAITRGPRRPPHAQPVGDGEGAR